MKISVCFIVFFNVCSLGDPGGFFYEQSFLGCHDYLVAYAFKSIIKLPELFPLNTIKVLIPRGHQ